MKKVFTALLAFPIVALLFAFSLSAFWQPPKPPPKQQSATTSEETPQMFTVFNRRPNLVFATLIFDTPRNPRRFTNFKLSKISDFTATFKADFTPLPRKVLFVYLSEKPLSI